MNEYLECIVKLQYGVEVGDRKELVRCKDCKHSMKVSNSFCDCDRVDFTYIHEWDWYCADGVKRDG